MLINFLPYLEVIACYAGHLITIEEKALNHEAQQ